MNVPGVSWSAVFLAAFLLSFSQPAAYAEADVVTSSFLDPVFKQMTELKDHTGHFGVMGTNRLWNASLMRWLEATDRRVDTVVGIDSPFEDCVIRISTAIDQVPGQDPVWAQGFYEGQFIQQLTIYDYAGGDLDQSDRALCGLLLNVYLWNARPPLGGGDATRVIVSPTWLVLGVARNLYPHSRAEDGVAVLELWKAGKAPALRELLEQFSDPQAVATLDPALCGFFVAWLAALPERGKVFSDLFSRLASGAPITAEWLIPYIPEAETANDVDVHWDAWVLREKRVVREPGVTTPQRVIQLREELRIPAGDRAHAEGSTDYAPLSFEELIENRRKDWARTLAGRKGARLQILFLGRGDDLRAVVGLYADFLMALSRGSRERKLRELLKTAESAMIELERSHGLMPESPAVTDPGEAPEGASAVTLEEVFGDLPAEAP